MPAPLPKAVLKAPLVLAESARTPIAVLLSPLVLAKSARYPFAVLFAVGIITERFNPSGCVDITGCVAKARLSRPRAVLLKLVLLKKRSIGRVEEPRVVAKERNFSSRVVAAGGVV